MMCQDGRPCRIRINNKMDNNNVTSIIGFREACTLSNFMGLYEGKHIAINDIFFIKKKKTYFALGIVNEF